MFFSPANLVFRSMRWRRPLEQFCWDWDASCAFWYDVVAVFDVDGQAFGWCRFIQGSFAVKFGHRIVYLCSVFLVRTDSPTHLWRSFMNTRSWNELQMFIACIWCALSPNLASIRASRVFQGFGMSALQRCVDFPCVRLSDVSLTFHVSLVASSIEQIFL